MRASQLLEDYFLEFSPTSAFLTITGGRAGKEGRHGKEGQERQGDREGSPEEKSGGNVCTHLETGAYTEFGTKKLMLHKENYCTEEKSN